MVRGEVPCADFFGAYGKVIRAPQRSSFLPARVGPLSRVQHELLTDSWHAHGAGGAHTLSCTNAKKVVCVLICDAAPAGQVKRYAKHGRRCRAKELRVNTSAKCAGERG